MRPVGRAIWYIEAHSDTNLSLDEIAENACVTKHYLLRAFAAATGLSIMRYLRARRMATAARRLASGATDIIDVAIGAGYGSHEAFTRAFREQFGVTPESVRTQGHVENLRLQEPIVMSSEPLTIEQPRFETSKVMLIAGLKERYEGMTASAGIPAQWQRFTAYLGSIPGQLGATTYGVCYNTDDEGGMDYLAGVAVADFQALPKEFQYLRIPATTYAVFVHRRHISTIRGSWNAIWNGWLLQSGHEVSDAPIIERYDERFDPQSGNGEIELWVPIR